MKLCVFMVVYFLTLASLSLARVKAAIKLGAPEKIETDDLYVQAAAKFVVLEINTVAKGKKVKVLVDVKEGTTQVVAGLLYKLVLEVGESEYCEKDDETVLDEVPTLEECPVNVDTIKEWYADVWMKPVYPLEFELLSLQEEGEPEDEASKSKTQ